MRISDWSSDVCSSDLFLERNDHRRQIGGLHPAPRAKFLMGRADVYIGVVAGEAIEEPALPLPAPAALPQFADQVVGKVVAKLVGRGRDQRHLVGGASRFLAEFAQGGGICVLARLDSTLWPLPRLNRKNVV